MVASATPAAPATPHPAGRRCTRCRRDKPADAFYASKYLRKDGTRGLDSQCRDCRASYGRRWRERTRPPGKARRMPRVNAAGRVYCSTCAQYLPATRFRRHPTRPGTWWTNCIECTRAYDRERYRIRHLDPERRAAEIADRVERKRKQKAREHAERARFVADAIGILRRRGFTKSDICKLAGVTFTNLRQWERGAQRPTPAVAGRFGAVMLATAHYRTGDELAYRRRLPHPDLPALMARLEPELARYPVRSRWKEAA